MNTEALETQIRALEDTALPSLVGHRETLAAGTTLEAVYSRFKEHAHEFVGVVDATGAYLGVVSRGKVGFVLGSRYGFSLFNRDPVEHYLLSRQLAVGAETPLLAVLQRALTREGEEFHHDVALVDAAGGYAGMVTVRTLVQLQNQLSGLRASLNESQGQSLREKAALRQSEERLRLALEAGQMSAWQLDMITGNIVWGLWREHPSDWSRNAFPASRAAFEGGVHPDDLAGTRAALETCGTIGRPFQHLYRYRPDEGSGWRWIESRGHAGRDEAGRVLTITGLSIDVTERRAAEAALQAAKEDAERANNAKSEFLSRMSHELRTPLNAILGFAQLLELEPFPPREMQSVAHILKGGRHLLSLIDEVLDITRIESGGLELSMEPTDAGELLTEVVALVRPLALPRGIAFHGPPPCGAGEEGGAGRVLADRQRLRQVLLNLLSNAVKYNRAGGEVHLACGPGGAPGRVRLGVRDTGPGIAPELMPRLFTPFDRLGVEARLIEGTGIGLTISKRLAEAMGGRLTVQSAVGEGSTFTVELDAVPADAALILPPDQPAAPQEGAGLAQPAQATVLQIEDNPANLSLVERIFDRQHAGVRLLSAAQGGLGIELAREHRPDLVLLDLHLPDLSGEEVLRRLRGDARTRRIPVVVLSADATPRQRQRLAELGARDYLTKPLDVGAFLGVVDAALAEGAEAGR